MFGINSRVIGWVVDDLVAGSALGFSPNLVLAPFTGLSHRSDRDLCTLHLELINSWLNNCRRCEVSTHFDITAHYITGRGIGSIESATVYPILTVLTDGDFRNCSALSH